MTALVAHMGIRNSNTLTTNFNPVRANDKVKLAGAFRSNDSALSIDGGSTLTDGTVTIPTTDKLDIGGSNESGIKEYSGTISRLTYWNDRLSNDYLTKLTS